MESWDLDSIEHIEEFKLMLFNRSNSPGDIIIIQRRHNRNIVDVKLLLQYTIKSNAYAIIICHNHPSGNLQPSDADKNITYKVKSSATIMDIQLLDHIIIIPEGRYLSMTDEGII